MLVISVCFPRLFDFKVKFIKYSCPNIILNNNNTRCINPTTSITGISDSGTSLPVMLDKTHACLSFKMV